MRGFPQREARMDPANAPDPAAVPASDPATPGAVLTGAAAPRARAMHGGAPAAPAPLPSVAGRVFGVMKREPVLFVSVAYILVSFLGLWSSYWFYRRLGLPILDYLQGSDLFIAGLRRPDYALTLGAALLVLWLSSLPLMWTERHPERARQIRERHWWGVLLVPEQRGWLGLWGVRTDTLLVVTFLALSMYLLFVHSNALAERILAGRAPGQDVRLTLAGEAQPLPGRARLLGTTSAFVMVWWPVPGHVEALPVANVSRIQPLGASAAPAAEAGAARPPATPALPAGPAEAPR